MELISYFLIKFDKNKGVFIRNMNLFVQNLQDYDLAFFYELFGFYFAINF